MKIITYVSKMQSLSRSYHHKGRTIGFVPTMGCLHNGHISLISKAVKESDIVIVSIFVNPTQFGPSEDYGSYPRTFKKDCELCRKAGVDIIFHPSVDEMYKTGNSVYVQEDELSRTLCGVTRPHHFGGVLTVVSKLFNIVLPDIAVFGQKDAQQVRIIEQLIRDLNFPVRLIISPTIREKDGLAMSSRNRYLSPDERKQAVCLYKALLLARKTIRDGIRAPKTIRRKMLDLISHTAPKSAVDYIEIVDSKSLRHSNPIKGRTLIALAVKIGSTRLIDNIMIDA